MKKNFLYFGLGVMLSLVIVSVVAFKQNEPQPVQKQAENKPAYEYCELLGEGKIFSMRVKVSVDFGTTVRQKLKDTEGKVIKFNSMIDAMNYMSEDGWEFHQAYVVTHGSQNVYHWLMRRKIAD